MTVRVTGFVRAVGPEGIRFERLVPGGGPRMEILMAHTDQRKQAGARVNQRTILDVESGYVMKVLDMHGKPVPTP